MGKNERERECKLQTESEREIERGRETVGWRITKQTERREGEVYRYREREKEAAATSGEACNLNISPVLTMF